MLGLSGRDGGFDEELVASSVDVADEGAEFVAEVEAAPAARAGMPTVSPIVSGFKGS